MRVWYPLTLQVTVLFLNVPIDTTILLLKKWLKQHVIIIKTVNSYVELGKLCMNDNYFQFNGRFYKQTFGTSMGSTLSPFLAKLFMAEFETKLSKLKIFPRIWIRYVEDILCVMKTNTIERLLDIMNRRHNTIKFTYEIEQQKVLFGC
jgi:hypothetical protein